MTMIKLPRRRFLTGLVGLVAAPAVVKAVNLMPVKTWLEPNRITRRYMDIQAIRDKNVLLVPGNVGLYAKDGEVYFRGIIVKIVTPEKKFKI
jgi:hypothetical protein